VAGVSGWLEVALMAAGGVAWGWLWASWVAGYMRSVAVWVAVAGALGSDLVAHSPALAGVRGMSQGSDATAASDGQEGRERNPWIKARPRLDLLGMRNFPTRSRQLARALAALVGRRENRRMRRSLLT
jgi:hypothetical protein